MAKGDLLFTLDDSLLRAQLAQIDGQIARDEAQIVQAARDLARAEELLVRRIDTPVQRDTAETALKALQAQKAADLGQRQSILAQIGFTEIRAPVSGRIAASQRRQVRSSGPPMRRRSRPSTKSIRSTSRARCRRPSFRT